MVLAWLVAAAALLPQALLAPERLLVQSGILGSESASVQEALERRFASPFATSALLVMAGAPAPRESASVQEALERRFASPFATSALLVMAGAPAPDEPEGRALLEEVVAELRVARGVKQTLSHLDHADPLFVGRGGGSFVVLGLDPGVERVDRLVPSLRAVTARLEARLRARAPQLRLSLTGEGPINYDIWRTSTDDTARSERRTLPLTLVLLAIAFGAAAAAVLPVVSGALAVGLSLGVVSLLAARWPLAILALNVVSMLGLALGIDYALLSVSRFREAREAGQGPAEAARTAARHAGDDDRALGPSGRDRIPGAAARPAPRAALGGGRRARGHLRLGPARGHAAARPARGSSDRGSRREGSGAATPRRSARATAAGRPSWWPGRASC